MAGIEGNVILLTSISGEDSVARDLYDQWALTQDPDSKWGQGRLGQVARLSGSMTLEVSPSIIIDEARAE